jgi:hypothetical protein
LRFATSPVPVQVNKGIRPSFNFFLEGEAFSASHTTGSRRLLLPVVTGGQGKSRHHPLHIRFRHFALPVVRQNSIRVQNGLGIATRFPFLKDSFAWGGQLGAPNNRKVAAECVSF